MEVPRKVPPEFQVEAEHGGSPRRRAAVIFFLALGLRLLTLAELSGSAWNEVLLGDARHFDQWGLALARGAGTADEVFYQAPLYPYFLGLVYRLFGHAPDLVRLLQCGLGALAALWIAAGTRRLAGPRAGFAAGLLAALYAPAIWYDLQLEKTSLATSLSALLFWWLAARAGERALRWPLVAGLALGALVLLRENAAVLLVPLSLACGAGGRWRAPLVLLASFALVLLPVALRNQRLGGAFLPTAANAGVNFYIGNGAEADGQYRPLIAGRGHPDHEREDATRIAQDLSGRALSPGEVSAFWFALAAREIAQEPGHFAGLLVHKTRLLAQRGEIMDAVALEVFRDESWVLRMLAPFGFGLLLPLALAGAVLAARSARTTLLAAGLLALSIVAFFVFARFRLGLVPFLLPFAGIAVARAGELRARPLALAALGLGLLAAWWPLALPGDPRATSASNLASELLRRGEFARAADWARQARQRDPRSAEAAFNLGLALRAQGRDGEAEAHFRAALELEPAYAADCLAELGALRARAGDADGALTLFEQALTRDPGHAAARAGLAELARSRSR